MRTRCAKHGETCSQKWRTKQRHFSNAEICKDTVNQEFSFPAEGGYPQNHMADQQKLWISELQFDKFLLTLTTFSCWKIRFKTQVSYCSSSPSEAMLWTKEVEMVDSLDDLKSPHSIQGCTHFPNFDMLDARIASALNKIIQNSYFKKKVSLEEQKAQKEDRFLRGRQIAYMIYDNFRVTGAHDTVLDYTDLFSINLGNDDVLEFDTRRDVILLSITKIPTDDILESLIRWYPGKSVQIKITWVWSTQNRIGIGWHGHSSEDIGARLSKIENDGEEKHGSETLITKLWHQKWERMETGAVIASRRGSSAVERRQGVCCQWKAKGLCSRGDQCSFRHEGHERAKATPKTAPSSEPPTPRGTSASRRRNLGGRSPSVKTNRQPCKNFLKGTCTKKKLCDYLHPPECQFFKSESGCKFGTKCSFPHWNVEEQPNQRPKKGGDKSAVAIVKDVRPLGCVSQDTEPPDSATISREGTKILGPIRRVRFTRARCIKQVSEKIKDHRLKNTKAMRRGKAWNLAKSIYKLKDKDKLHSFRPPMSGFCRLHPP